MPKADNEHTSSRRTFLGHLAGGAAVVAVAAGVSTGLQAVPVVAPGDGNPDAELIAFCAEHDVLECRARSLYEFYYEVGEDPPDELLLPIRDEQDPILDRILDL
jgi:hypothetical protein